MRQAKRLILFDIDGTLVRGYGLGKQALLQAIEFTLGQCEAEIAAAGPDVLERARTNSIDGKTDLQFLHECLEHRVPSERITNQIAPRVFDRHVQLLRRQFTVAGGVRLIPGVTEVLELLAPRADCALALLTGNVLHGARAKLELFDLNRFFLFGAFGDEARFRHELPPLAVRRAREILGYEFSGKSIVIIGDTPNDVECGRALGVRAIAVATGLHGYDQLAQTGADYVFPDLCDTTAVLDAIFAP